MKAVLLCIMSSSNLPPPPQYNLNGQNDSIRSRVNRPLPPPPYFTSSKPTTSTIIEETEIKINGDEPLPGSSRPKSWPGAPRRRVGNDGDETKVLTQPPQVVKNLRQRRRRRPRQRSGAVPLAVGLWFTLGVCSIASTKMLLSKWQVPPLILSVQQFALGGTVLHLLQPIPRESPNKILANLTTCLLNKQRDQFSLELFYTGLFFGLGFVATNYSFQASAASFVETVKAAEPITSALVAVSYGVDIVGFKEALSLCGIVAGVLVSTVGKGAHNISTSSWVYSFFIIFLSNLCFSFRGLHQKLLQQTREGDKQSLTDVMLQYRMQWISKFNKLLV